MHGSGLLLSFYKHCWVSAVDMFWAGVSDRTHRDWLPASYHGLLGTLIALKWRLDVLTAHNIGCLQSKKKVNILRASSKSQPVNIARGNGAHPLPQKNKRYDKHQTLIRKRVRTAGARQLRFGFDESKCSPAATWSFKPVKDEASSFNRNVLTAIFLRVEFFAVFVHELRLRCVLSCLFWLTGCHFKAICTVKSLNTDSSIQA